VERRVRVVQRLRIPDHRLDLPPQHACTAPRPLDHRGRDVDRVHLDVLREARQVRARPDADDHDTLTRPQLEQPDRAAPLTREADDPVVDRRDERVADSVPAIRIDAHPTSWLGRGPAAFHGRYASGPENATPDAGDGRERTREQNGLNQAGTGAGDDPGGPRLPPDAGAGPLYRRGHDRGLPP